MTAVLSVLPSSRVTLEHVEAPQSCNRIATAAAAAAAALWRGSSGWRHATTAAAVAAVPWMVYGRVSLILKFMILHYGNGASFI